MGPGVWLNLYYCYCSWSKTPPKERARIMYKIADLVEERLEEFAEAESKDQGKPVWLAKAVDIPRVCHNFRFFATASLHYMDTLVDTIDTVTVDP